MPDDLQEAKRLAKAGRKAEARQIATRLVRKEKDNVAAWVVLAQVVDTREQAIDCLKQVLRLEPGHPWAMMHLSRLTEQAEARPAPPPPPVPEPEPEPAWEDLDSLTPAPEEMSDLLGDAPAPPTARPPEADLDPLSGTTPWRRPATSMDVDTFDDLRAQAAAPPRRRARWLPLVLLFVIFVAVGAGLICAMQMGLLGGGAPPPAGQPSPTAVPTDELTEGAPVGQAPAATDEATEPPDSTGPTEAPTAAPTAAPTEEPATVEPTGQVPPPVPGGTGNIIFAREVDDSGELFLINPDGSGLTQLTTGAFVEAAFGMDRSPDGTRIAFVAAADVDGDGAPLGDIFIVNADGTGLVNLTQSPANDVDPQWSPDGRYIAFASEADEYRIAIAPTSLSSLPATVTYGPAGVSPAWSPDGASIAFSTLPRESGDIYALDVACALGEAACEINPMQLTSDGAANERPEWSPDGTRIAYVSGRDDGPDLWAMNPDGSAQTRLSTNASPITLLAWSPDGTRIAYEHLNTSTGNIDIYMAGADGSGAAPLVAEPSLDFAPAWSPDGAQLVFQSHPDLLSPGDIFLVNADGSGLTPLATEPGNEMTPLWRP